MSTPSGPKTGPQAHSTNPNLTYWGNSRDPNVHATKVGQIPGPKDVVKKILLEVSFEDKFQALPEGLHVQIHALAILQRSLGIQNLTLQFVLRLPHTSLMCKAKKRLRCR